MIEIEVGYIFETQFGLTDVQGITTFQLDEDESIEFEPSYIPPPVTAWYPVFTDVATGAKRTLPKKKRGELATLDTNDAARLRQPTQPVKLKNIPKEV